MPGLDVLTLRDGGQEAEEIARRVADFIRPARRSLELALYDVRLPDPVGAIVADELRAAADRGVTVRLAYNADVEAPDRRERGRKPAALHPPPQTRPEILEGLPIEVRGVPGIPDLMHHKYAVRDDDAVWTGSANWTIDSWQRQENVIAIAEAKPLAELFRANFAELWSHGDVERSGHTAPRRTRVGEAEVHPWFTPGHGEQLSQRIATAIGAARERVRIASPVITSGPVLATLAELVDRGRADAMGVVDGPQVAQVFRQWAENPNSAWKIPLLEKVLGGLPFAAKPSTPWRPDGGVHDFMHCKLTVTDDVVFLGSFNLSRSGEQNAENMLEIRDAGLADRLAGFVDEIRSLYPAAESPAQSRSTTSSEPSASST
jgi:phosphatidylserine/phosphatidylglycerophosphate/cardiolipin synthase-like enzyme